jgi:hypothetical protein
MAGISGCKDGAFSIVMSGAYEDATDEGETLCVLRLSFSFAILLNQYSTYIGTGMHPLFSRWATEAEGFRKGGKRDSAFGVRLSTMLMNQLTPLQSAGPQVADQSMEHPHNKYLAVCLFFTTFFPRHSMCHTTEIPGNRSACPRCSRPRPVEPLGTNKRVCHSALASDVNSHIYSYRYDGLYSVTEVRLLSPCFDPS